MNFNLTHPPLSITPAGSTPSLNGASINGQQLTLQPADGSNPGLISTSAQTIAGVKSFSSAPILSSLTASQVVATDGSKSLTSLAYSSTNTNLALVQRDGSGNFSAGTITASLTGTASGNTTYTANQFGIVASGSGNAMFVIAPDASTNKVLVSGGASANAGWSLLTNSNLSGTAAISNANLASMASTSASVIGTVKGNISGSSAVPSDVPLTSLNTASSAMLRNASGNFAAGAATLTGATVSSLTASQAVFTDGSKGLVSNAITGTGSVVMDTSPTIVTPTITTMLTVKSVTGDPGLFIRKDDAATTDLYWGILDSGVSPGNSLIFGHGPNQTSVGFSTAMSILYSGAINLPLLTASTALALDSGKNIVSVTNTGSGSNVLATSPTLVTPVIGAATGTSLSVSGQLTSTVATGTAPLVVSSTTRVSNLNVASAGNADTVTTNANLTGDVTSVGNATTLTNAPVIAKVLTGYVSGAGTVAATDSILQAIQKLNGNDATNANLTGPITSVGNATSVASQTGTGSKFVMDTSPTVVTPTFTTRATIQASTGDPALFIRKDDAATTDLYWGIIDTGISPGNSLLIGHGPNQTTSGFSTIMSFGYAGGVNLPLLTASTALALDSSKNIVSVTNTGTGNNVLSAGPSLTGTVSLTSTPVLGVGTTTPLVATNEQIINSMTAPSFTTSSTAFSNRLTLTGNTPSSGNLRPLYNELQRVITASTTDTINHSAMISRCILDVASGQTYTNSNASGLNAYVVSPIGINSGGSLALNYAGFYPLADSTAVTGYKFHIRLGGVTGGTSGNAMIGDNTSFSGTWVMNFSSTNPSILAGALTVGGNLTLSGLTASRAVVTDGSKNLTSSATTATQVGYLSGATGTTGTGTLVFNSAPTMVGQVLIQSPGGDPGVFIRKDDASTTDLYWGIVDTSQTTANSLIFGHGPNNTIVGFTTLLTINYSGAITMSNLAGSGSRAVNADASGTLSAASDSRLKTEVPSAPIPGLAEVMQIQPKAYKWNSEIERVGATNAATEIGFFANDVAPIIPSAAPICADGYYGFYDRSVTAALVKAVQELKAEIDQLKKKK